MVCLCPADGGKGLDKKKRAPDLTRICRSGVFQKLITFNLAGEVPRGIAATATPRRRRGLGSAQVILHLALGIPCGVGAIAGQRHFRAAQVVRGAMNISGKPLSPVLGTRTVHVLALRVAAV